MDDGVHCRIGGECADLNGTADQATATETRQKHSQHSIQVQRDACATIHVREQLLFALVPASGNPQGFGLD